jgi:phosphoserine aminotransferase
MVTFSPGPSQVYPQLEEYLSEAFHSGILSVSHRSEAFNALSAETIALIRSKLAVPENYTILYTSSATECWEIIAQSLTRNQSIHFSSGSFGDKWHHYARCIHPRSMKVGIPLNEPLYAPYLDVRPEDDVICLTQNETSNGTQIDFETLASLRGAYPDRILALDCTSSMAGIHLPFALGDVWFASVQKCFGLPAGLGLMILSPAALERASEIGENAHYNSLTVLLEHMKNYQTSCTPNVLGIFLLNRVLHHVPRIEEVDAVLRRRMEQYLSIFPTPDMKPLVSNSRVRSVTVLAVEAEPEYLAGLKAEAKSKGMLLGSGYGKWKSNTFRIANFPAISTVQTEALMEFFRK